MKKRFFALLAAILVLALPLSLQAQVQQQFPTTPWNSFAPARIQCGQLSGANFNVTTEQAIPI